MARWQVSEFSAHATLGRYLDARSFLEIKPKDDGTVRRSRENSRSVCPSPPRLPCDCGHMKLQRLCRGTRTNVRNWRRHNLWSTKWTKRSETERLNNVSSNSRRWYMTTKYKQEITVDNSILLDWSDTWRQFDRKRRTIYTEIYWDASWVHEATD